MIEPTWTSIIQDAFQSLASHRTDLMPSIEVKEIGIIKNISSGIAIITGLPGVANEELVKFQEDLYGIVFNLDEEEIGVILLGDGSQLQAGNRVERTGRVMDVPVGEGLIGRVINPLGVVMDGKGPLVFAQRLPVEREAPAIMDREPVVVPMETGIKVIDALIPIGRGQRELILGDRQTGKTAIAVDTIINQKDKDVICIYCAISQRASSVAKVIADLEDHGAMNYSIVVVAESNDAPGLSYIAPYAATAIAEYFMTMGKDVLLVYDDLTQHARAYREISLLMRRPPGREAFPGDIFYIHSRLLERITHLKKEKGGGSITALPIVETEAQIISAYIPTNLISITDGQLYLSPKLVELGLMPAIDIGMSVSRVGGEAQRAAYRSIVGPLKLAYSQFEELETFARFGTKLEENIKKVIEHGKRIRACLKQDQLQPVPALEQIVVLYALSEGLLDNVPLPLIRQAESLLRKESYKIPEDVRAKIILNKTLEAGDKSEVLKICKGVIDQFLHSKRDEK